MKSWKLEDAKNRFSEVVRLALADQPQRVTHNGRDAVVVISAAEYDRLSAPTDLLTFCAVLAAAEAMAAGEIDLSRSRDLGREGRRSGRELPVVGGLLLATAAVHGLTLVTRNERDCDGRGVQILNPWLG
jgi:antitoxin Phd